uniref:uncharacterized protein LOC122588617 n=1 Tax=Erigeron canadensis TaxID=72917 RepID=UPI001CB89494|nr:uncharacterized protein LOC122588617 [Erigeron canadensis]
MDGKQLVTNIIALSVLVITMVVNVCIQLRTGVLNSHSFFIATIDVIMLFLMLMIYVSSALTILKSKQILESKYQACHDKTLNELAVQQPRLQMTEKLTQYLNKHWVMAVSGSPQFMVARSATSSAAGVICCITSFLNLMPLSILYSVPGCNSDYKWSTLVILMIQYIGLLIGLLAPFWRCYALLTLISRKWICSHIKVFKVESYCTQKLYEWKRSNIPLPIKSRRCKIVIHTLKVIILSFCVGLQMVIVVACKMTSLIPILFVSGVVYRWNLLKGLISTLGFVWEREPQELQQSEDLWQYVLQLQDDVELADGTLKTISNSVNQLIQKAQT